MSLTHRDWNQIYSKIQSFLSKRGEPFVQGVVIRRDAGKKLVWLEEFGSTPIPLFGFNYKVTIYQTGVGVSPHTYDCEIVTPKVGDTVLVAQHLGSRRLPKCLGVVQSTEYVSEDEVE